MKDFITELHYSEIRDENKEVDFLKTYPMIIDDFHIGMIKKNFERNQQIIKDYFGINTEDKTVEEISVKFGLHCATIKNVIKLGRRWFFYRILAGVKKVNRISIEKYYVKCLIEHFKQIDV